MQVGPGSGYADACIQCDLLQPEESQSQEITLNACISRARCCASGYMISVCVCVCVCIYISTHSLRRISHKRNILTT